MVMLYHFISQVVPLYQRLNTSKYHPIICHDFLSHDIYIYTQEKQVPQKRPAKPIRFWRALAGK